MKLVKNLPKQVCWVWPMQASILDMLEEARWSLMHMKNWVFKWAILIAFSLTNLSIEFRVLVLKELDLERWESDVFINIKNKACEKTSLPLKRAISGFI